MKNALRTLTFIGALAVSQSPLVQAAEEVRLDSSSVEVSQLASEARLYIDPISGRIIRMSADGQSYEEVDPSTIKLKYMGVDVAAGASESLEHRRYHRHRHYHRHYRHRHYRRYGYYGDRAAARAFGIFLGGVFYAALNPCSPWRYPYYPYYCYYW